MNHEEIICFETVLAANMQNSKYDAMSLIIQKWELYLKTQKTLSFLKAWAFSTFNGGEKMKGKIV